MTLGTPKRALWALVLAPRIFAKGPPAPFASREYMIWEQVPRVALDYVAERFASKLTDEAFYGADEPGRLAPVPELEVRVKAKTPDGAWTRVCVLLARIDHACRRRVRAAGYEAEDQPYLSWFSRAPA